jgi:hypothetical protein
LSVGNGINVSLRERTVFEQVLYHRECSLYVIPRGELRHNPSMLLV